MSSPRFHIPRPDTAFQRTLCIKVGHRAETILHALTPPPSFLPSAPALWKIP